MKSGFPLQLAIAADLRRKFGSWELEHLVQEEWSYVDRDEGKLRPADIHATVIPKKDGRKKHPRVRPDLVLIIECRQSRLPYVFFEAPNPMIALEFPVIAGLRTNSIQLKTDRTRDTWSMEARVCLGLFQSAFVSVAPAYCHTFDRLARGKGFELSGIGFNDLIPPLIKAIEH
jgi:hypothetical protein